MYGAELFESGLGEVAFMFLELHMEHEHLVVQVFLYKIVLERQVL